MVRQRGGEFLMDNETRKYLESMEARMNARFDKMDGRLDKMDGRLDAQSKAIRENHEELLKVIRDTRLVYER